MSSRRIAERMTALHVDVDLPFLIERCGVRQPRADSRLNAIENTLAALIHTWRNWDRPFDPATELRASAPTCHALLQWIRAEEKDGGRARRRLVAYESPFVVDAAVPDGWLRVLLSKEARQVPSSTR